MRNKWDVVVMKSFIININILKILNLWLLGVLFQVFCHFAKKLVEKLGNSCDEVVEGESKEKAKGSTKLTDQRIGWENQHLGRKNMRIGKWRYIQIYMQIKGFVFLSESLLCWSVYYCIIGRIYSYVQFMQDIYNI